MLLNCGVGEDSESPLYCKEIQLAHPKGDQSWVFTGRTDIEDETPILWPPDAKSWFIWKDPDARKDWGQEKKGTKEDEMIGWHHRLDEHVFEWTLGVGDGQGVLACCGSWGCKELDMTEWLKWTELNWDFNLSLYLGHNFLFFSCWLTFCNVSLFSVGLWFFLLLLFILCWRRLSGLCKLPAGRDQQWDKLYLVLVGRVLLSKTLILLSADGWGSLPPC